MKDRLPRKLAAILYADVAGYSRLTGEDEDATHRLLSEYLDLIAANIEEHHGRVMHYAGDAVLAQFSAVVDALSGAVAIQNELIQRNQDLSDERKVLFRIGVNLGDVIEDRGDIYGDGVNVAARLESLAEPGGICISESVHTAVGNKLPLNYEDIGDQEVKNIAKPVRAYKVVGADAKSKVPSLEQSALELPDKPSIAVLAFTNMSGDPEQEYLADGISEDLITALSKIRWFMVIARSSTFTYKGKEVDVKQVASDLGVRYVLEGSVRKAGNRVRITAQLIDADTGHHVWAERYDREMKDIFDLQDEMTQTIAGALEPELGAAERERAISKPPENLDAWETYQRALWYMWSFEKDKASVAVELFRRAVDIDPTFSAAYAYLAYSHYIHVIMGWVDNPDHWLAEGMAAAKKALQCDDKDAVAYFAAGRIHMMRGEHDDSVAALEKSLELNPSFAQSYHGLGFALALSGKPDEAKGFFEKAEKLSPRDPLRWAFTVVHALACILAGENEDAVFWAHKTMQIPRPSGYWPHAVLAAASANLDRLDDARKGIDTALKEKPDLSLAYLEKTLPTKEPGGLKPYLDGLRKAGLPE